MADKNEESPPFGHFTLNPWREKLRRMAGVSRTNSVRRIFASAARRASQFAHPDPFDVEVFKDQKARLYPRDNLCEKRVFAHPDSWDNEERACISQIISEKQGEAFFNFVDAGANVGMYTLFILGEVKSAGKKARVLAIEPDPVNRQRLTFNVGASAAMDQVTIVDKALGAGDADGHLIFSGGNRGEIRLATSLELSRKNEVNTDEYTKVDIVPFAKVLDDEKIERIDMLKIDIEGGEADVFRAFFVDEQRSRFPQWIILETISKTGEEALQACLTAGYQVALQTRMNAVLRLQAKQDGRKEHYE